ncbi:HK97 gp10 family phage protein, partial [Clostridium tagluense]|uniref:HK97 gp10 family phage protein n=1 Tax=Clostridium tagluense TaxID=360422 RepID=UPI000F627A91
MSTTSIDNLADEIMRELENYSEGVTEGIKKAVDVVAKEVNEEIKSHVTFTQHSKKYVKAFKIKNVYDGKYNKGKTWHVSGGEYRLTHLLEKGHATRN